MLLSQLLNKPVYCGTSPRGVSVGIGFSLKNYAVKYLLCSAQAPTEHAPQHPEFAVNVSAISAVADGVHLAHARPVLPKTQTKLCLHLPVYSYDGIFLGNLIDGDINDFVLHRLFTDKRFDFPPSAITACRDAVFLRKEAPYPLGQRVPSPLLLQLQSKDTSVTKPLLRRALQRGTLVKLTLSLPPFALFSDE